MRAFYAAAVLVLLAATGCDTVGEGAVTLAPRDVQFMFTVDFDNLSCGSACTVASDETASLAGNLDGFQLSEIVGAQVTAVRLERISPPTTTLGNLLGRASVRLGSGVAASGDVAAGTPRETMLAPSGIDVADVVGTSQFRGTLGFAPRSGATGTARFRATLTLSVEVEGL